MRFEKSLPAVLFVALLLLMFVPVEAQAQAPAPTTAPAATPTPAPAPAPASPPLPSIDLPAPLARVLTDYEDAWRRKDSAALAALFAEDGFVLMSGSQAVRGRAAIQKKYEGMGGPLALRAFAYATGGSVGYIIGAFGGEKGQPDSGKFTLTLRKAKDGRWLVMSDMDNGNRR